MAAPAVAPASRGGGRRGRRRRADEAVDALVMPAVMAAPAAAPVPVAPPPPVAVSVDVVVFTLVEHQLATLLIRRAEPPFEGRWSLPGGFVGADESLEDAAARQLREETGVEAAAYLEQLGTYGDPNRDPRLRVVSVAYLAIVRDVGPVTAGASAAAAELVPVAEVVDRQVDRLAFDHHQILDDALETVRSRLEDTPLATAFVGPEFTLSELRTVYESAWGTDLDPGNFRRKILSEPDVVVPTGRTKPPGPEGGKPPETYAPAPAPARVFRSPYVRPKRRDG